MLLRHAITSSSSQAPSSDQVFSTYLYTGNGSTQTINNGIDLAGKGGLVWIKSRNGAYNHNLTDTVRGATKSLFTNTTGAESVSGSYLTAFNNNGFSVSSHNTVNLDTSTTYASWTFAKSSKFFDVITYTGNGVAGRQIAHSLGVAPGMVVVKATNGVGNWYTYHVGQPGKYLLLNSTNAAGTEVGNFYGNGSSAVSPSGTYITVGADAGVNGIGNTYVAYLFAHDTSADGIIQCGSFTTDASGNATVTLGWEPQWVLRKKTNSADNWEITDVWRGMPAEGQDEKVLQANLSNAETPSGNRVIPNPTGFKASMLASSTYIYLAIRRPNKVPTSGTEVYNAIARTGTGAAATVTGVGFAPDLVFGHQRTTAGNDWFLADRLRGSAKYLFTNTTNLEATQTSSTTDIKSFDMDGMSIGTNSAIVVNTSASTFINHFFKRAPKFFDIVCYTGTGVARTVSHNLQAVPEWMIVKARSEVRGWGVYSKDIPNTSYLFLNGTNAQTTGTTVWNSTTPSSTAFTVGSDYIPNKVSVTYVAYLFASLPGISKCGSYTGNGSTQTIDCGFAAGARFVLIKSTSTTGNWLLADTARGLVADNDPLLYLNSTLAEITTLDWIDPHSSGFVINQEATASANATGVSYIYLAIA